MKSIEKLPKIVITDTCIFCPYIYATACGKWAIKYEGIPHNESGYNREILKSFVVDGEDANTLSEAVDLMHKWLKDNNYCNN